MEGDGASASNGQMETEYEWELSKENVQPIKQGRKFANLSAALQPNSDDLHAKLREERQFFESQLRTYSGDDPLEIWHGYIRWTEENFPKGGKDSNLSALLGRCVQNFTQDERYKNDTRYLEAWMKLSKYCTHALEIFDYMHNNGIGCQLAAFYEAWAWELERLGNTKRADNIFTMALQAGAQPIDTLRKRHSEFQARVARMLASGDLQEAGNTTSSDAESQRLTLGQLKGRGKKQAVPNVRTGAKAPSRGLDVGAAARGNNAGQSFKVFSEVENVTPAAPPQTGEWSQLPTRKQTNRENEQRPGVWKNAKLPQRGRASVPAADVSSHAQPTFAIHTDEGDQPMVTPRKVIPQFDPSLSEKKGKQRDPFEYIQHVQQQQDQADGALQQVPCYCKAKIYAGVSEFSFEELRAFKRIRKDQEKEARARELAVMQEKMRQEMMKERQELLIMFEKERQEWQEKLAGARTVQEQEQVKKAQHAREEVLNQTLCQMGFSELPSESRSQVPTSQPPNETVSTRPLPQVSCLEKQASQSSMLSAPSSGENSMAGRLSFQSAPSSQERSTEGSLRSYSVPSSFEKSADSRQATPHDDVVMDSMPAAPVKPILRPAQRFPTPSNVSLNASNVTPSNASLYSSGMLNTRSTEPTPDTSLLSSFKTSFRSSSRGSITAPSPTVNTREAMEAVRGMFNQSMTLDNMLGWNPKAAGDTVTFAENDEDGLNQPPLMLYEDAMEDGLHGNMHMGDQENRSVQAMGARKPFAVHADKENAPLSKAAFSVHMDDDDMTPAAPQPPATAAPFVIHDDSKGKPGGSGGFVIHEDPENRSAATSASAPFSIHMDTSERHAAEASRPDPEGFEAMAAEDMVSAPPGFHTETHKMMDDSEISMAMHEDMTFAPGFSSTRNFTKEARLASTPFNPSADFAALPAPPLSTIKPVSEKMSSTESSTALAHEEDGSLHSTTGPQRGALFTVTAEQTHNATEMEPGVKKLSPIMERSEDSTKSSGQASSMAVSGFHTTAGDTLPHHLTHSTHHHNMSTASQAPVPQQALNFTASSLHHNTVDPALNSINMSAHQGMPDAVSKSCSVPAQPPAVHSNLSLHNTDNVRPTDVPSESCRTAQCKPRDVSLSLAEMGLEFSSISFNQNASDPLVDVSSVSVRHHAASVADLPEDIEVPSMHQDMINQTCHEIDITNYIHDSEEQTMNLMSQSIMIDPHDPFDESLIQSFLQRLPQPLEADPRYVSVDETLPAFKKNNGVALGRRYYEIQECLGQGAYAKVYKARMELEDTQHSCDDIDESVVIKVQKPACQWEFYIVCELHRRLAELQVEVDVRPSIMLINEGYFFQDGSCLVNELHSNGTLLDLANLFKRSGKSMHLSCFLLLTLELLHIAEQLQRCQIIHGDIKPDNFLFLGLPTLSSTGGSDILTGRAQCIKLIDFGRSIDMTMFPPGTTFMAKVTTSGFECIEMKTDRPWTYQTDIFGIVGTMYVLAFGEYMRVLQTNGIWHVTKSFRRFFKMGRCLEQMFSDLLNIPSCDQLPDLSVYRRQIEDYFKDPKVLKEYNTEANRIEIMLFEK